MKQRVLSIAIICACAASAAATPSGQAPAGASDESWRALTIRLEQATRDDDTVALKAVRGEALKQLLASPPAERAVLIRYAVAYIGWRLAFSPAVAEREQNDLLEEAEAHLEAVLKINPRFAEGHALLGGVLGAKIAKSPIKGILLGPRSSAAVDQAMELEPDNPRVLLANGTGKFNTPAMFGGSDREAETLLRKALERFAAEPADKPWPNWGRVDVHAWLGQVLVKRGDKAGALAEYEKALALAPKSGWIQYMLMPAAK
jgi:tetratricopeptide (TPR) repeat protein